MLFDYLNFNQKKALHTFGGVINSLSNVLVYNWVSLFMGICVWHLFCYAVHMY